MERELTEVYCGNGKGKTALAIGQSIREAVQGKSVIVIQFLKGCEKRSLDFMEDLDNLDFKIFRFEKRDCCYKTQKKIRLEAASSLRFQVNKHLTYFSSFSIPHCFFVIRTAFSSGSV